MDSTDVKESLATGEERRNLSRREATGGGRGRGGDGGREGGGGEGGGRRRGRRGGGGGGGQIGEGEDGGGREENDDGDKESTDMKALLKEKREAQKETKKKKKQQKQQQERQLEEITEDDVLPLMKELIILRDIPPETQEKYTKTFGKESMKKELFCKACNKKMTNLTGAKSHIANPEHEIKFKEYQLEKFLPIMARSGTPPDFPTLTLFLNKVFEQYSAMFQRETRLGVGDLLQQHLKEDGLDVLVSVFGSSVTGYAVKESNVNINIQLPGPKIDIDIANSMKHIAASLKKREESYANVEEDYFSFNRIPRILFVHKPSALRCEIRVEAGNPAALTSLLRLYAEIDSRCLQLAVLFRRWAFMSRMDNQKDGHYPAHMFILMVIHFLQQVDVLPVLHELYVKETKKRSSNSKSEDKTDSADIETETKTSTATPLKSKSSEGTTDDRELETSLGDDVVFEDHDITRVEEEGEEEETGREGNGEEDRYEIDYLCDLSQLDSRWKSTNQQSLGELWFHLFIYYTVEFKIREHAVTIRQKEPLPRGPLGWGEVRLAVEDPMIPKSNLGRGSASNQVFNYLMGSMRFTAINFSAYSYNSLKTTDTGLLKLPPSASEKKAMSPSIEWHETVKTKEEDTDGHQAVEAKENEKEVKGGHVSQAVETKKEEEEEKEGNGGCDIEYQDSSIVSVSSSTQLPPPPHTPVELSSPVDLSFLRHPATELTHNQPIVDDSGRPHPSDVPTSQCDCTTVQNQFQKLEIKDEKQTSSKTTDPKNPHSSSSATISTVSEDVPKILRFLKKDFVFQSYPISCLNCKKLKHSILECPELDYVSRYLKLLPSSLPGNVFLESISKCFRSSMRAELPDENDIKARKDILISILEDIHKLYPGAILRMFGSSANGFGSKMSDLDICLTMPPDYDNDERDGVIEKIAKALKKKPSKYRQVFSITTARVPIVKLLINQWEMQCDISLENKLALRNTKMLQAYTRIDRRVQELGCALKRFAKTCDMCDASTGSLSSYAYILMLLHYLQNITPPVVPVLQQIKPGEVNASEHKINEWDCYFYDFENLENLRQVWDGLDRNTSTTGELWLGMLKYYTTEFDWNYKVVTIRRTEPLHKFDKWWIGKPMCIEDPFNLDHNLGGGVSTRMRAYILDRCMDALRYHSNQMRWIDIRKLMDPLELKKDVRAPKFMRCHTCGSRAHKAADCPKRVPVQNNNKVKHQSPRPPQEGQQQEKNKRENYERRKKNRGQERVVYNVPIHRSKDRTPPPRSIPPQSMAQMMTNSSPVPISAPPHHSLFHQASPPGYVVPTSQPPYQPPLLQQSPPAGYPGYLPCGPVMPQLVTRQQQSLGAPLYPHPNTYLVQSRPYVATRPQQIFPHTAVRSPPYRQFPQQQQPQRGHQYIQQVLPSPPPAAMVPYSSGTHPNSLTQNVVYTRQNPGLITGTPPPRDQTDGPKRRGRGRRQRQKTNPQNKQ